ncbi:uncharacterized protein LTR77_008371 [Saxophila tyrrhenica]|uniref:Uncharacterized protein n=1 Tax=Saxophila tyrrhenica TaxID=1690608 RepID=A0AAV9P3K9_9PEZI|nr:hypothetical protein LTR77_008371 [Saxophila tyrrhenica]
MMGEGFTKESTRQHYKKLRKESEAQFGNPTASSTASASVGTPRKPGKLAQNETPGKSGGKRKKNDANGEDDEEVEGESPTKKQVVKQTVKKEEDTEDSV